MCAQFGITEERINSHVLAIKKLAIHPFKIQCQPKRAAHPNVLKLRPPQVHHEALHTGTIGVLERGFDQLPVSKFRPLVRACPIFGAILNHDIKLTRHEGFKPGDIIFIKTIQNAAKIKAPLAHWQIITPILRIAFKADRTTKIKTLNQIRTTGNGRRELDFVERRANGPFAREHRHAANDQGQFAVGRLEIKPYRARIKRHTLLHIRKNHLELRFKFIRFFI